MARVFDIVSVRGGVRHSCDQCDYKTKWKDHLETHKESFHGVWDSWYKCDQCGKSLCLHF